RATISPGATSLTWCRNRNPATSPCRTAAIAVDIYVPARADGSSAEETFPAITIFTPYYRRFRLREGSTIDPAGNAALYRDFFVPCGYAVVVIDVRGTGASFGTRDSFRSPNERRDSKTICDW